MTYSEQLMQESNREENDFKAWALHFKSLREKKFEYFKETLLPEIQQSNRVATITPYDHFFKIEFVDSIVVDYYPKADRLFFTKQSKWQSSGFSTLEKMI